MRVDGARLAHRHGRGVLGRRHHLGAGHAGLARGRHGRHPRGAAPGHRHRHRPVRGVHRPEGRRHPGARLLHARHHGQPDRAHGHSVRGVYRPCHHIDGARHEGRPAHLHCGGHHRGHPARRHGAAHRVRLRSRLQRAVRPVPAAARRQRPGHRAGVRAARAAHVRVQPAHERLLRHHGHHDGGGPAGRLRRRGWQRGEHARDPHGRLRGRHRRRLRRRKLHHVVRRVHLGRGGRRAHGPVQHRDRPGVFRLRVFGPHHRHGVKLRHLRRAGGRGLPYDERHRQDRLGKP